MSFYIQALFIAIPIFSLFIIIEWIIASKNEIDINRPADFISSRSSGMSNITKDGMKLSVVLISYSWLVDNFTIYKLEPLWIAAGLAFLVQDFLVIGCIDLIIELIYFGIDMSFIIVVKSLIWPLDFAKAYPKRFTSALYL